MGILNRLLGRPAKLSPTAAENHALGLVLRGDDPRHRQIRSQLPRAPEIEREVRGGYFRVAPTSTFDDLSFTLEVERLESDWLRVTDAISGRELEFRVVLGRHGFLSGLEGRTVDGGPWPEEWSIAEPERHADGPPLLRLPSLEAMRSADARARVDLEAWLGVKISSNVELVPPVPAAQVAARERAVGGAFAPEYRRLLTITDGLTARGVHVPGHRDAQPIDNPQLAGVVIAWDADNREDYVVVIALGGVDETVYRIDIRDEGSSARPIYPRLSDYLRPLVRTTGEPRESARD